MSDLAIKSEHNSTPQLIVLAGNPNSGKTTIFNALTGLRYKVANYPGVTVERKTGRCILSADYTVDICDLPGIYSLAGQSIDESIAIRSLLGQLPGERKPDLIVVVVDSSNLERNLYLCSQIIDLQLPVVVALNMSDIAQKRGISIKGELLSRSLGVPVLSLNARANDGLQQLVATISAQLNVGKPSSQALRWIPENSSVLPLAEKIGALCANDLPKASQVALGLLALGDPLNSQQPQIQAEIAAARNQLTQSGIDPDSFEATFRYLWIHDVVQRSCVVTDPDRKQLSDQIDKITTHRVWGTCIFVLVMAVIFQSIFLWSTIPMDFIDGAVSQLGAFIGSHLSEGLLRSLLVDGVIAGVGSVLVFVPQIAVLFFFLGLLEDSGYLSRAAFLMDRLMRPFGLQGRSFIPLLSSFACAIPGIMSTRTIPSLSDRLTTILVAPLMSCSARLPVYTLLISAFIPSYYIAGFISLQALVLLSMYLLGIIGAALVSWLLKLTLLRGTPALFVMEMPIFRRPALRTVLREVYDRVIIFLRQAGTIILACSIILWFLATFPRGDSSSSFAAQIGHAMEPVLKPLGYSWELGVAILASFAAREVFVSALATVYNVQADQDSTQSLLELLKSHYASGTFTLATALSLMVFYVFACQCMSTVAVCKRETASWSWTGFMFGYMMVLAYGTAWITYNVSLHYGL